VKSELSRGSLQELLGHGWVVVEGNRLGEVRSSMKRKQGDEFKREP
jgi:hypothetical protein